MTSTRNIEVRQCESVFQHLQFDLTQNFRSEAVARTCTSHRKFYEEAFRNLIGSVSIIFNANGFTTDASVMASTP